MATLSEKLQLTLDTKNGIKKVLEDNDISLTDKTFADYPEVIKDNLGGGMKMLLYSGGSTLFWSSNQQMRLYQPFKVTVSASLTSITDWAIYFSNGSTTTVTTKTLDIQDSFIMNKSDFIDPITGVGIRNIKIGADSSHCSGWITIESI